MTWLLAAGFVASLVQVVCIHNEHYGAGQGWGALQMVVFWLYLLTKGPV